MQTSTAQTSPLPIAKSSTAGLRPWLMLFSRSALFILFQALAALIVMGTGIQPAWEEAGRYWMLIVLFANIGSVYLLIRVFRSEGKRYWDIFRFSRETWRTDLIWFIGLSIIGMPFAALPREPLAAAIFDDPMIATDMLFRPIPTWAFVLSFLFPLTIAFAELPTYFGYCMPRLFAGESATRPYMGWIAWLIASFFLAAQHMFLPTIFNGGYLLWRLGMFLPFALFTGLALKFRPTLLPYFAISHGLLDITIVLVYLMI